MKTIEERAKEYASDVLYPNYAIPAYIADVAEESYIAGAKEQKAIDEEVRLKKCDDMTKAEYERGEAFADWYQKNGNGTPAYSDAIEWARQELIDEACEWLKENIEGGVHPQSAYGFADRFRKAMEE